MNKSSNNWRVFLKSVWFGIIAGMISGMVKIGWLSINSRAILLILVVDVNSPIS